MLHAKSEFGKRSRHEKIKGKIRKMVRGKYSEVLEILLAKKECLNLNKQVFQSIRIN